MVVSCSYCGKEKNVLPSVASKYKNHFCNKECRTNWRRNRVTVQCAWCGKYIEIHPYKFKANKNHFCCRECQYEWIREHPPRHNVKTKISCACEMCGKELKLIPSIHARNKRHYCGRVCADKGYSKYNHGEDNPNNTQIRVTCEVCGKIFFRKLSHATKSQSTYCSRDCAKANILKTLSLYPKRTKPERLAAEFLDKKSTTIEEQVVINDKFCVDILISDESAICKGIIIEVLGDYFHANPEKYSDNSMNLMQKKTRQRDKSRYTYLTKCGYKVFGIWEKDIYKDASMALKPVMDYIENGLDTLFGHFEHVL